MKNYLIKNAHICLISEVIKGDLLVQNDTIVEISPNILPSNNIPIIDAKDAYVAPGLFEVHIHGQGGSSFQDLESEKDIETIHNSLKKNGVNTYFPTFSCVEYQIVSCVNYLEKTNLFDYSIPGIYIEGPFISPQKKGALGENTIKSPTKDFTYMQEIWEKTNKHIKIMTFAPELDGVEKIFSFMLKHNITPSIGHSNGLFSDAKKFLKPNTKIGITHLYNAMTQLTHRQPGLALIPYLYRQTFYELITDGIHVDKEILKMTYNNLPGEHCIVISDSTSAACCQYGNYRHLGEEVVSKPEGVFYKDQDIFVGSNKTVNECLEFYKKTNNIPMHKLVTMATYNPAKLLNLDETRGKIELGRKADLIIIDENFKCIKNLINN